jgi:hypothetical protein
MAVKEKKQDPNKLSADQVTPSTESMRVSLGNPYEQIKEDTGTVTRGNGCATKGTKARGPMA